MRYKIVYALGAIIISAMIIGQTAQARLLSVETDPYTASQPYQRRGIVLEVWATDWLAVGTGMDYDKFTDKEFSHTVENTQPLMLRFIFEGFFFRYGMLESLHKVSEKQDSSSSTSTNSTEQKALLAGSRMSAGIIFDFGFLFITGGYFQESTAKETLTFPSGNREIGGQLSGITATIGVGF